MIAHRTKFQAKKIIIFYLICYFLLNLLFLENFPFIHSDEPWLSGLSRSMLTQRDFSVTEPFFDTYERHPHAIKLVFHWLQMIFIKIFGYHIFFLRLLSLLFSLASLYVFFLLGKKIFSSSKIALFITIILSLDLQYIYASHFARQEVMILFIMMFSLYILLRKEGQHTYTIDLIIGTILGLGIGIHPNSFIAALAIGSFYLVLLWKGKIRWKNLLLLILVVALFASLFIVLSFSMDKSFLGHYQESGQKFGVHKSISEKLLNIGRFYKNIYLGKSVTYYMPHVKFQLILFALCFILTLAWLMKKKNHRDFYIKGITLVLLFIHLGMVIIGRYNVTSILFIFPFIYLLVAHVFIHITRHTSKLFLLLMIITLAGTSLHIPRYSSTYDQYINSIAPYVPREERVLSNLNTQYYFRGDNLFDYRNLQFMKEQGISFEDYIASRKIKYILYYDEIDYIYEKNPIYNGVYGDVSSYYQDMQDFLHKKCQRVHSFTNSTYGTNISRLIDKKPWGISIFKVVGK